jgi:hypothetical protein
MVFLFNISYESPPCRETGFVDSSLCSLLFLSFDILSSHIFILDLKENNSVNPWLILTHKNHIFVLIL